MQEKDKYKDIYNALSTNQTDEALGLIQKEIEVSGPDSTLLYLRGKVHMKHSQWSKAMTCFLQAEELDPEGPARQCRLMLNDIMDFYNKDMYNQ